MRIVEPGGQTMNIYLGHLRKITSDHGVRLLPGRLMAGAIPPPADDEDDSRHVGGAAQYVKSRFHR